MCVRACVCMCEFVRVCVLRVCVSKLGQGGVREYMRACMCVCVCVCACVCVYLSA